MQTRSPQLITAAAFSFPVLRNFMSRYHLGRGAVIGRTLIAVVGGYALALAGSVGIAVLLCRLAGVDRADAFVGAAMLAFLLWAVAAIVAFAARSTWRALGWVLGTAVLLALIGWSGAPLPPPAA